jgi:hypothetical protein
MARGTVRSASGPATGLRLQWAHGWATDRSERGGSLDRRTLRGAFISPGVLDAIQLFARTVSACARPGQVVLPALDALDAVMTPIGESRCTIDGRLTIHSSKVI